MNEINKKNNPKYAWRRPFSSDFASLIIQALGFIINLFFFKGLNFVPLLIILLIILDNWLAAFILLILSIPLFIFRFILTWFLKNHKDVKVQIINKDVVEGEAKKL